MGWASAGDIFNPVAQALIDLGAADDMKRGVLGPLIDRLCAEDWDTCDESAEEFADDPTIAALFAERGYGPDDEDDEDDEEIDQEVIKAAILAFSWHNFGLDEVGEADPEYATHLADEIATAISKKGDNE